MGSIAKGMSLVKNTPSLGPRNGTDGRKENPAVHGAEGRGRNREEAEDGDRLAAPARRSHRNPRAFQAGGRRRVAALMADQYDPVPRRVRDRTNTRPPCRGGGTMTYIRFTPSEYRLIGDCCRRDRLGERNQPAFRRLLVESL